MIFIHVKAKTQDELVEALMEKEREEGEMEREEGEERGEWHETSDMYGLVVDLMWRATGRSFFGQMFDDEEEEEKDEKVESLEKKVEKDNKKENDGAQKKTKKKKVTKTGRTIGDNRSKTMERAKLSFQTFDDNFPLLAGGVPRSLLSGVQPAMSDLFSRFSNKNKTTNQPSLATKNVSEIVQFRQNFLIKHFDHHSQGSFQLGFVWATMANTLPTAFWCLYFVTRDLDALHACREEADRVMGPWLRDRAKKKSEKKSETKTEPLRTNPMKIGAVLSQMPKIEAVVSECLRLCIASLTLRHAMTSFDLKLTNGATVSIRKGDQVVLAPTLTHFDEEIYPNPTVFQWDRFLVRNESKAVRESVGSSDKTTAGSSDTVGGGGGKTVSLSGVRPQPSRYKDGKKIPPSIALQPFGGGSTMCPGKKILMTIAFYFV